jgi:hypothetical protein
MKKMEKAKQNADNEYFEDAINQNRKQKITFFALIKKHSTSFILITSALLMFIIYFGKEFESNSEKN